MSPVVIENHSVVFSDRQQPPAQRLRETDEHMRQQLSRRHVGEGTVFWAKSVKNSKEIDEVVSPHSQS